MIYYGAGRAETICKKHLGCKRIPVILRHLLITIAIHVITLTWRLIMYLVSLQHVYVLGNFHAYVLDNFVQECVHQGCKTFAVYHPGLSDLWCPTRDKDKTSNCIETAKCNIYLRIQYHMTCTPRGWIRLWSGRKQMLNKIHYIFAWPLTPRALPLATLENQWPNRALTFLLSMQQYDFMLATQEHQIDQNIKMQI